VTADELERLLVVQEHDLALDRLQHRRDTLPARAELEQAGRVIAMLSAQLQTVTAERDTVRAEEQRLDDEAQGIAARAAEVDKQLYSGTVTSPRELQAMQSDIDMLNRHRRDLEDRELDVMERRETLDTQIATGDSERTRLEGESARLRNEIAAAEGEIDAEIATERAARADVAAGVSDNLLRDYEKRRVQNRGAGAARLVGTTCQACHLTIPSTEAERIRRLAGTEVAYCDNCSAILVP
jgi:predicted  nucleic acid-binding Zn-ribbon protein